MSIRKIVDWAIQDSKGEIRGLIASEVYESHDIDGSWVWACNVDIGQAEVLRAVPVASNNREIIYAEIGKPVYLKRMVGNKYSITGLAKTQISTIHYLYVSFADDIFSIVDEEYVGFTIRPLTYGELADYGGYGVVPYGARGKFDADGTFVSLIGV